MGYVYEHVVLVEKMLGRSLRNNEVVHHLNGVRGDNRITNLLVLERSQHAKLHAWLNAGAPGVETAREKRVNSVKTSHREPTFCEICFRTLQGTQSKFCGRKCQALAAERRVRPSKIQLEDDMAKMSVVKVGKKYGVSDNCIRKWMKQYMSVPSTLSRASGTPEEGAETKPTGTSNEP